MDAFGDLQVWVDANFKEAKRQSLPSLTVHRISATVVGVEHCKSRREIFTALMTQHKTPKKNAEHQNA